MQVQNRPPSCYTFACTIRQWKSRVFTLDSPNCLCTLDTGAAGVSTHGCKEADTSGVHALQVQADQLQGGCQVFVDHWRTGIQPAGAQLHHHCPVPDYHQHSRKPASPGALPPHSSLAHLEDTCWITLRWSYRRCYHSTKHQSRVVSDRQKESGPRKPDGHTLQEERPTKAYSMLCFTILLKGQCFLGSWTGSM